MKNKSILLVSPSAYSLGGVATWVDYLQPGLMELGWECTLGLVEGNLHHKPLDYLKVHPSKKYRVIECMTSTSYGRCDAMAKVFRDLKPDIVLSVNIPDVFKTIQWMREKSEDTPFCAMSIHGIQADLIKDAEIYSKTIDAVVATNKLTAKLIKQSGGLTNDRIFYAPYGVELRDKKQHKNQDKLKIIYSGRLEQDQKRIFDIPTLVKLLETSKIPFLLE